MPILANLHPITRYFYDRPVSLGPQMIRLRPLPHCRTRVHSYSLTVNPAESFGQWQQDPHGKWLARYVFSGANQSRRLFHGRYPGKRPRRILFDYLCNGRATPTIGTCSPCVRACFPIAVRVSWAGRTRDTAGFLYDGTSVPSGAPMMSTQLGLFESKPRLPEGFRYEPRLLTEAEERALVAELERLPFKEFEFHGFSGKRRVVSFGWHYDFNHAELRRAAPIPRFALPIRDEAARFAGLDAGTLEHLLVTEYGPGAAIGWHKDRAMFADVIGISVLAPCTFRFRRKTGATWQRASARLAPRSAYLLRGPARTEWEHSIPGMEELRYSLTFRNFKRG
jgi:alkylated DNA repair dioxygenase AlkB